MGHESGFPKKFSGKYFGDKWKYQKLDRKASRGMIYENEELRLRTININAEVERGQSDIRKLRRENEQLRREIWSLRDEYDRLDKLLRANRNSDSCDNGEDNCGCQTEDCSTCEMCEQEEIENENDDVMDEEDNPYKSLKQKSFNKHEIEQNLENAQKTREQAVLEDNLNSNDDSSKSNRTQPSSSKLRENLHVNFDHLSIVSEENLSVSDCNSMNLEDMENYKMNEKCSEFAKESQAVLEQIQLPVSPCLGDLQSIVPPLAYFENLEYEKLGPTYDSLGHTTAQPDFTPSNENGKTTSSSKNIPVDFIDVIMTPPTMKNEMNSTKIEAMEQVPKKTLGKQNYLNFFSQIKRRAMQGENNYPDIFVANALASPVINQTNAEDQHTCQFFPLSQKTLKERHNCSNFQTGGNLEELLMDIETLSKDILHMQLEKHKSWSREILAADDCLSNRKPYRSEINLVLKYNGTNPVITPITKTTSTSLTSGMNELKTYFGSNYEKRHIGVPDGTILYPQNFTYLGFERFQKPEANALVEVFPVVSDNTHFQEILNSKFNAFPSPITSPSRCPTDEASVQPDEYVARMNTSSTQGTQVSSSGLIAFRQHTLPFEGPGTLERKNLNVLTTPDSTMDDANNCDNLPTHEAGKHKSRRVSLTLGGLKITKNEATKFKEKKIANEEKLLTNRSGELFANQSDSEQGGNYSETGARNVTSQANSSHSVPRRNNSNQSLRHHHHSHNRKMSQESTKSLRPSGSSTTLNALSDHTRVPKRSRRYSEATMPSITSNKDRTNRSSGHFRDSLVAFSSPRDSLHELGPSMSERTSNSLGSSRESSASLSTPSQRRKMSTSSNSAGKIPWCGCWGNGCL